MKKRQVVRIAAMETLNSSLVQITVVGGNLVKAEYILSMNEAREYRIGDRIEVEVQILGTAGPQS